MALAPARELVLLGVWEEGAAIAACLSERISARCNVSVPVPIVDLSHRTSDFKTRAAVSVLGDDIRLDLRDMVVVVVDDVVRSGATFVAAMRRVDGRAAREVHGAFLVDAGGRVFRGVSPLVVGERIRVDPAEELRTYLDDQTGEPCEVRAGPPGELDPGPRLPAARLRLQLQRLTHYPHPVEHGVFSRLPSPKLRMLESLVEGGHPVAIAQFIDVDRSTIYRWIDEIVGELGLSGMGQLIGAFARWQWWRDRFLPEIEDAHL